MAGTSAINPTLSNQQMENEIHIEDNEVPSVEWNRTYTGAFSNPFEGLPYLVVQTADGGYAIAGCTPTRNFWLIRTEGSGNIKWNRTYGGTGQSVWSFVQTNDEGFVLAGGGLLVKTDSNGDMQWNRTYPQSDVRFVIQTSDGGYALACIVSGAGNDGALIRTDSQGNSLWNKTYGGPSNDQFESVFQTSDGGYAMAGATQSFDPSGKTKAYLVKTDSGGNIQWNRTYSRTAGHDYGRSVIQTRDGGYAITGQTDYSGSGDGWLIKTDSAGNLIWDKTYDGHNSDSLVSIVQTSDEGYALAGQTDFWGSGDVWLIKADSGGNEMWNETFGGSGYDRGCSVIQTHDKGFAVSGFTNSFSGNYEIWLIKLASPSPRTIVVPDDYSTIQSAINAANYGDTVLVRSGTYYEHLVVNASIVLVGEDRYSTKIDGSLNGEIVDIKANNVHINNFTLQNAGFGAYGAVWINGPFSNAVICNNTMIDNRHGVAVYLGALNVTIRGNLIYNREPSYADGIRLFSSETTVLDNTIANESTGIGLDSTYNNTIQNCTVTDSYIGIGAGNPSYDNVFLENTIANNSYGFLIAIYNSRFFHNNIINNAIQASFYGSNYANNWDNGYPSGGNYWSDYKSTDLFSGQYQNVSGSDGIGDTPYVINQQNTDHYPLMNEFPLSSKSVAPVADFTYSPRTPIANETVTFDASISKNGWNGTQLMDINSYAWDFGDDSAAIGRVAVHIYVMSGNFTVTLNVTDTQGLWNVTYEQVQVGQPHNPLAVFTISPEFTHVDQDVELNASASLSGWNGNQENPITSYVWDFGDGNVTISTYSMTVHNYRFAGNFNVVLTVSDSENMTSTCSHSILVIMPTSVSVGTSATSTLLGYVVKINGTLSDIHGEAIENEPVVLYYTFPAVSSLFPITSALTDGNGQYSVEWIPTATGTFCVVAEWMGNMTYSAANSNVTISCIATINQYVFSVESNSTITGLAFNTTSQELSFTASGPSGTEGYAKVTVAKSLVSNITNIRVYLDNNQTNYSIVSLDDSWLLTFNYTHSTHKVAVNLDITVVPEFPSTVVATVLLMFLSIVLVASKRRSKRAFSVGGNRRVPSTMSRLCKSLTPHN